ncbi:MAG: ComC/BlpC family leader-containing pheromone/bacteriocin [Crocinitomix sp.]|nr:ComC/BlpC family leader-containing pheromone/bacteriocin [Crocinitomix sp.]
MKKKKNLTQFNTKNVLKNSKLNLVKGGQSTLVIIDDIAGF